MSMSMTSPRASLWHQPCKCKCGDCKMQNAKCTVAEDVIWAFFPLPTLNWPMSKSAATSWLTELETPPNQTRLDFYFLRADLYPFLGMYLFLKQSDCWKCLTNESKRFKTFWALTCIMSGKKNTNYLYRDFWWLMSPMFNSCLLNNNNILKYLLF